MASSASREHVHPRDHVSLEDAVDDIDALGDLGEQRIVSVETPVISKVEEPLAVPGVVARVLIPRTLRVASRAAVL